MNGQMDLSGLRGLHLPSEPSVFPLAVGWWFVIICLLLVVMSIFFGTLLFLQSKHRAVLKEIRCIKRIEDTRELLIQMNNLAKKVAIEKLGREKIASLYGQRWINFLNSGKRKIFSEDYVELLHKTLYTKDNVISDSLRKRIIKDYSVWIRNFNKII